MTSRGVPSAMYGGSGSTSSPFIGPNSRRTDESSERLLKSPPPPDGSCMGTDPPRSLRVVQAYLDDVAEELTAFDALFAVHNRLAAFHLEQAAEKLIRAVRIHRNLQVTNT